MARISLSKDAMGSLIYFSSTSHQFPNNEPLIEEFSILSGTICQCESPLIPVDAVFGDRPPGSIVEHMFSVSSSAGDVTWSNLVVNGPALPAIAPMLAADGTFTWDTANSRIGLYTFSATVSDQFGDAIGQLTVTLVPEPASISLLLLGLLTLAGFRGKCL